MKWGGHNSPSPSPSICNNDSVIDREGIGGQTSNVPGTDLDWLAQSLTQRIVTAARDLQCLQRVARWQVEACTCTCSLYM